MTTIRREREGLFVKKKKGVTLDWSALISFWCLAMSKAKASAEEDFIRVGDDISFYNEEHGHGFMAGPLSTKGKKIN